MAEQIDFSKYSMQETLRKKEHTWKPPVPEATMRTKSRKIAVSTRVYPDYLLALYAYFEQVHGITPTSLSELLSLVISELINVRRGQISEIPPADMAIDHFISLGFMNPESRENQKAIFTAHHMAQAKEHALSQGASLKEQYDYWKVRDPEQAEQILEEMSKQATTSLDKKPSEDTNSSTVSPASKKPDNSKVSQDNIMPDKPGAVPLSDVESVRESE